MLAFEVFEPGLESAGAQLVITNFLEGINEVRESTRGLVLIQPRGVGVLGKDLARGVGGIAFGIKVADGPCGRSVDRHFNEVSVFGYRGAVGFDGLANLFAGDACSLLNEVLVESQEFFVAECSVVESVSPKMPDSDERIQIKDKVFFRQSNTFLYPGCIFL
ncbi:hypothetical protein MMG03_003097 [Fibrobacter succinogenes]|nr:hypothetical protein [Fibrobacter succinogenes]